MINGWRVAWTPDLDALIAVDEDIRCIADDAVGVFRMLGARVDAVCPAFWWREQMRKNLVSDVEHGLALTTRNSAHSELSRSAFSECSL